MAELYVIRPTDAPGALSVEGKLRQALSEFNNDNTSHLLVIAVAKPYPEVGLFNAKILTTPFSDRLSLFGLLSFVLKKLQDDWR